jgi:hypothetical protein
MDERAFWNFQLKILSNILNFTLSAATAIGLDDLKFPDKLFVYNGPLR